MFAMIFGIISGALAAISTFGNSVAQGNSQRMQAASMEAQAAATRRNAQAEQEKGRAEAYEQDRQKARLRRQFEDAQSANRVSLAAGNVDMTSGSALDVSVGNIDRFAEDMGDNAYAKAMKEWETREKTKSMNWQADVMDANASYLNRTAATVGSSLLTAGISGLGGFAGGYTMAGGRLSGLFGGSAGSGGLNALSPGRAIWSGSKAGKQIATSFIR